MIIILLHGLGEFTWSLKPLELYLNYKGYKNTHLLSYPVNNVEFEESLDNVDRQLQEIVKKDDELTLIGQSMGGLVSNNLHTKGWNIRHGIYIGSPLHGAKLLNQIESIIPLKIKNTFFKKSYKYLQTKGEEFEPPHSYNTITMGWGWSDFDGCVYKNEAILDPEKNMHITWADHRTVFVDPRLWIRVEQLLNG